MLEFIKKYGLLIIIGIVALVWFWQSLTGWSQTRKYWNMVRDNIVSEEKKIIKQREQDLKDYKEKYKQVSEDKKKLAVKVRELEKEKLAVQIERDEIARERDAIKREKAEVRSRIPIESDALLDALRKRGMGRVRRE